MVVFYLSKTLEVQDNQRTKFASVDLKGSMKTSKPVPYYVMHTVACCLTTLKITKITHFRKCYNVLKILIQPAVWTGGCFSVQYMPLQGSSTIQAWREGI